MLTIDPPFYQLKGVTVFRDHEDLDQFYCLPPRPNWRWYSPQASSHLVCSNIVVI